ncbi:MAG TPA: dATP/dGTP diphosphohydrolase domain-containing protein [Tissierellaceae bacterium]|nr:dATP/dGTP diphosphohydrolase domain-containing protein [Tissierellaceae bacterium]
MGLDYDLEKYIFKTDQGKPRLGLVPASTIESVGKVMTYGLTKYKQDSWKEVEPYRYIDALMRHLVEYMKDENSIDEESGLYHIEHILCNAAFLNDMRGDYE